MVAPGSAGVEVGGQFWTYLSQDLLAAEFGAVGTMVEQLAHGERDQERVLDGPGAGLVAEHTEFERERVAVGLDVGVHAAGVGIELRAIAGGEGAGQALGGEAQLEDALLAVEAQEVPAQDLGEFAGGEAAGGVHLPQAVLSGDVALGEEQVGKGSRGDVGDAVGVADDRDPVVQAGEVDGAIELGQGTAGGGVKPSDGGQDSQQEQQEDDGDAAGPARAAGEGSGGRHGRGIVLSP